MYTTLTDSISAVRSVVARVRSSLAASFSMPGALPAVVAVTNAATAPNPFMGAQTRWLGGTEFAIGHMGTTSKRIHPGRLGGST